MKKAGKVIGVIGAITVVAGVCYYFATKKERELEGLFKKLDELGNEIDSNISMVDDMLLGLALPGALYEQITKIDSMVEEYNSMLSDAEEKYDVDFDMTYGYSYIDWAKDAYVKKVKDFKADNLDGDDAGDFADEEN